MAVGHMSGYYPTHINYQPKGTFYVRTYIMVVLSIRLHGMDGMQNFVDLTPGKGYRLRALY